MRIVLTLAMAAVVCAQDFPKGQTVDKVVCQADAGESYALYLPSTYDPARQWPVLFCFDPVARGKVPVERFREGAERFGYIVAGSNNSRNGPWAPTAKTIQTLIRDVGERFSADRRRLYTAGFSGGARVASRLAVLKVAAGVIACGAGFYDSKTPDTVDFVFFGAAGIDDFNYSELRRTDSELDARGARHRVAFFDGGHDWPPAPLCTRALEWMEIEAMRDKLRPKDDALIQAALGARLAEAASLARPEAYYAYKSLAADFAGFAPTEEYSSKAKELSDSREFRNWEKTEREQEKRQHEIVWTLSGLAERDMLSELTSAVAQWQKKAGAAVDSPERRLARRAIREAGVRGAEQGRDLLDNADYTNAAAMLELAVAVLPERAQLHYNLARARGYLGDNKKALAALKQAVARGYKDAAHAERDPAFMSLNRRPEFQTLLTAMKN